MRRAARSLIAASANSQLHTRSGYCSLVSEHSSPQQRDAVEASESQQSHSAGKVAACTVQRKMAFEEASRLLDPFWRDDSTPVAPLSTALVQRA
jgi:hypothetical protein